MPRSDDSPPTGRSTVVRRTELGVALVYVVLAGLWVGLFHWVLPAQVADPARVGTLGASADALLVAVTAGAFFLALRRERVHHRQVEMAAERSAAELAHSLSLHA